MGAGEGSWASAWERQRAAGGRSAALGAFQRADLALGSGAALRGQKGTLRLHGPGIEPGPPAWQARILPLNHPCPGARRRPPLPQRRWPPPARPCSLLARGHLSICSIGAGTTGGPAESQDPGTGRTPGRRDAGPFGPSRAFCADHGRRDTVGVARGGREPTPAARRRDPCQLQSAAWSLRPRADPKALGRAGFRAGPGWGVRERAGAGTPGSGCAGSASARSASAAAPPPHPRAALRPRDPKACEPGARALAARAPEGSGADGVVVLRRGALWQSGSWLGDCRLRQGAGQGGLGSGSGSGFPREGARGRRGRGRGPGACGWSGRARGASAPS